MKWMKLFFILVLAGMLNGMSLTLAGEERRSVLRGRISDEGRQALPGASVYIEELKSGAVSDLNGNYLFTGISAGKYHLNVSYIGYESVKLEITVESGQTIEKNIILKDESRQLEEVEVAGTFQGYQRAMNYQKSSQNLRNVVSADQVGRFPDGNIGDALKRISGINVQYDQGEARFGQIRGTSPDFSSVTINGNRLPSAEGDIRNVRLDLIPSDMVQTIVVNKVVTADMDADAIGGSVNLVTKSAPVKRMFSATAGTGWNFISDRMQANAAVTYGDNFWNKKLGLILSASYQNNPIGSDNTEFVWKEKDGNIYLNESQLRQYFVQRERQSYSASLGYRFNLNHRIDFKGIYNLRKDWENRYRQTIKDIDENGKAKKVVFQPKGGTPDNKNARLELQQTMDFALNGEHLFRTTLFNWNLSYARATEERPNERYIAYVREKVQFTSDLSDLRKPSMIPRNPEDLILGADAGYELDELTEQQEDIKETDFKGSVNLSIPLRIGYETGNLKFGAKVVAKSKKRDLAFYEYSPQENDFDRETFRNLKNQTRSDFYAGNYQTGTFVRNKYLGHLDLNNASLFSKTEVPEELGGIFKANETVASGFIRYDQDITRKLNATLGLRLENTGLKYKGKKLVVPAKGEAGSPGLEDTPEISDSYLNVLPSVLLKYDVTKSLVLRLAYTNTIARPKYYDLVPHVSISRKDDEVSLGNPELKATRSQNVDFSADYFFPTFGMVSAGVYYKRINDFIVDQRWTNVDYEGSEYGKMIKPVNAGKAELLGVELAWQRDLSFISPALRYLGLYANYTYTHSKITDFKLEREDSDGNVLKNENLPLAGSPEHIANVSLYFERKGLNLRLSYNFASDFIDEFGTTPLEDRYYDKVNYLDLNASYNFAKHYTVFAEANNLLNQPLRYYQGHKDLTVQAEYYGVKMNIGFKVIF